MPAQIGIGSLTDKGSDLLHLVGALREGQGAESLNSGLKVAFSAGTVMGFTVVGLGLLDISGWYLLLK